MKTDSQRIKDLEDELRETNRRIEQERIKRLEESNSRDCDCDIVDGGRDWGGYNTP